MKKYQVMFVDENNFVEYPYSTIKSLLIVLFYFGFVLYVFPYLASYIAITNNPYLTSLPLSYQFSVYLVSAFVIVLFVFKLLRKELFLSFNKLLITLISAIALLIVLNSAFAIIYEFIGISETSSNQSGLETIAIENIPMFICMVTVLAPFIEEIIFRGVIFRWIRKHSNFIISAIVSSLLFGFVHIMSSFFAGDFSDCLYIFLYAGLGFVFSFAYEYNKTIYACIILHGAYNLLGCIGIIFG